MAQEQTGVNNAQAADAHGVGQSATGTGDTGQSATGQGATVQPATEQTVPYERFREVNERMKIAEQKTNDLQQQFQLLQASQQRGQPTQTAQPSILEEFGISEDEPYIPTQHVPRILQAIDQRIANTVKQSISTIQGQQALTEMSDYADVVGKDGAYGFVPSEHLTKVLQKKPYLINVIRSAGFSPDTMRLAYNEVVNDPDYKQLKQYAAMTPQQRINAETAARVQQANQQVMSSSAVSAGQIGKVDAISTMSDDQVRQHRKMAALKT